ncbi:hypothetical protein [Plebeiibacterium marinum]|uniref:Uncharacterized protein n=1 Tax=Plebeiibacterium marinum TaxID=2992111 RepID=A0AAE3MC14_9BACT|nr:hypothetical protein [Plebeiobacterium marinum]MCW3804943.1 hypothetical protein [Plebeiobacterium marinum]
MKEKKAKTTNPNIPSYEDLEGKSGNRPNVANRNKNSKIQDELADDFGEVLGDGFHGLDDDYYYDEDDMY